MTTGEGIDSDQQFERFMTYIHEKCCKWYTQLDTVLASRHNVWPAYTNEDVINESSQDTREESTNENNDNKSKATIDSRSSQSSRSSSSSNSSTCSVLSRNLLDNKNDTIISPNNAGLDISDLTNDNENESGKSSTETQSTNTTSKQGCGDVAMLKSSTNKKKSPSKRLRTTKVQKKNSMKNDSSSSSKLTVMEAAKARKDKRRTIVDRKAVAETKTKIPPFLTQAESHFDEIFNAHNEKLKAQADFHAENMVIQNN